MSYAKVCEVCSHPFDAKFPHQKRCSSSCTAVANLRHAHSRNQALTVGEWESRRRLCRWCGIEFQLSSRSTNNRQYCSPKCQAEGYSQRIKEFHSSNPEKQSEYNRERIRRHGRDTLLTRLYRRYPDLPRACESCGEARVLDLAHKPGYERHGAHRTLRQYQRHVFWILCPTCHALVDRGICQSSEMGLSI